MTGLPFLADGTPVSIHVALSLDGSMNLGATDYAMAYDSPGGFTASSDVSASLQLYDPAITGTGEAAGPIDLLNLQADMNGQATYAGLNKDPYHQFDTNYNLTDYYGNNYAYKSTSDICDGSTGTICSQGLFQNFATGLLTANINSFVGDTLAWNGSLDAFNQAYGIGAYSIADVSHTFAVNLSSNTNNVQLAFDFPQSNLPTKSVPAPGT